MKLTLLISIFALLEVSRTSIVADSAQSILTLETGAQDAKTAFLDDIINKMNIPEMGMFSTTAR